MSGATSTDWTRFGPAVDVRPLFPREREDLLALLRDLPADAWATPTVPGWSVHDLVAHLVHDGVRRLSGTRDGHVAAWVPGEDLPRMLARANEEFVVVARGISPRVLVDLVEHLGAQLDALWAVLDLDRLGPPVSWAAPDPAPVWLDVAREFTEFWAHQQQIRDAVGRPGASDADQVTAVVDTFVRSVPLALAEVAAEPGTAVTLEVEVPGAGVVPWTATKDGLGWRLARTPPASTPHTRVGLTADTLWRVAVRGIDPGEALSRARVDGDRALAGAALQLLSIVR